MKKRVLLFGNGSYDKNFDPLVEASYDPDLDLIVAVDGGLNFLFSKEIKPDLIIGDLDSADREIKDFYQDIKTIKHPVQKDETDTELALSYLKELGYKNYVFIGMLGDRIDHSLANIYLLEKYKRLGIDILMINEKNKIFCLKGPAKIKTEFKPGETISLLALSKKVKEITIKGFEYPLKKFNLLRSNPGRAVSNIVRKDKQQIKFKKGILLVDAVKEKNPNI